MSDTNVYAAYKVTAVTVPAVGEGTETHAVVTFSATLDSVPVQVAQDVVVDISDPVENYVDIAHDAHLATNPPVHT